MQRGENPNMSMQSHTRCDEMSKAALMININNAATPCFGLYGRATRSHMSEQIQKPPTGRHTLCVQRPSIISHVVKGYSDGWQPSRYIFMSPQQPRATGISIAYK